MPESPGDAAEPLREPERLEREEKRLWRVVLLFLGFVALALTAASWQDLNSLPKNLKAIPLAALVIVLVFAVFAHLRRRELAELRRVVQGIQTNAAAPPSDLQLQKLTEALVSSQRGYRDLIDSFEDVILSVDLDGTVRAANRVLARLLELPIEGIIGRRLHELLEEPLLADAEKALPQFVDRRFWTGMVRVRFHGITAPRYYDCIVRAIVRDGQVTGASVLARDITAVRERETRFTELFESLLEGVYFSTPEGKILDANQAFLHMLGYEDKEEFLALNAAELYWDPAARRQFVHDIEQFGAVREREIRLRRKDGTPVVCLDTARAVWDTEHRHVRYQGTLVDITERREMEKRLHEEQEFRRRLVDSFPDLILALDPEGRFTFVSPRLTEMLGYDPESILGTNVSGAASRAWAPAFEKLFRDVISGKQLFGNAEYRAEHKDGSWRTLRAAACPLFDANSELAGVVASVRDVTELKQLEQQLIQSEKMAAMGQMIDGFAHELNNPLTAILGGIELLREEANGDEKSGKRLQLLQQQARRAAEIVQNLLFFSRPPQPGKARLNVAELIQRSLQLHEHSLRVNQITVDFLAEPSLPALIGDPNLLMQVFLSLIMNAEQAIREVRTEGTVRVRLSGENGGITVVIQDDGPGFSPEVLPRIFEPFFTTKRPGRGAGLGLSISMAILKKYGGNIRAANAPGGGAVITISLPGEKQADLTEAAAMLQN